MKDKIYIKSPSKINLCLEVLGKNNNELHEIKSVTLNLHLADELSIERYDTFEIVSKFETVKVESVRSKSKRYTSVLGWAIAKVERRKAK